MVLCPSLKGENRGRRPRFSKEEKRNHLAAPNVAHRHRSCLTWSVRFPYLFPALKAQVIDTIRKTDHKLAILEFDLRRVALIR